MTREEFEYTIKSCGCFIYRGQTYYEESELIKAFEDMGLIEQEPRYCDRNICLSNEYNGIGCDECEVTKSQEPSGDLINRQDAIKAIDEKAKRIKNADTLNGLAGAVGILFDLPSVKPQPCEDAISRQAVIDGIEELKKSPWATDKRGNGFEYLIKEALDVVADLCVKQASSVKPQEKTGHWIYIGNGHNGLHKCSECGGKRKMFDGLEKYCASCGAKMVEESEVNNG